VLRPYTFALRVIGILREPLLDRPPVQALVPVSIVAGCSDETGDGEAGPFEAGNGFA